MIATIFSGIRKACGLIEMFSAKLTLLKNYHNCIKLNNYIYFNFGNEGSSAICTYVSSNNIIANYDKSYYKNYSVFAGKTYFTYYLRLL